MCAQKASRNTSQTISAVMHAAMQKVSVSEGGAQDERRQIPSVTAAHASADIANTHPCGAPGLTAA